MLEVLNGNLVHDGSLVAVTLAGLFLGYYYLAGSRNSSKGASLDDLPGPERHFLLGNLKNFPRGSWTPVFAEWREKFGDVIYLKLPNRRILVVSSLEDAEEFLVKRSNIWSHRAYNRVVND
ncbi:1386_t:CDS:2, partial [Acaulospora colombiana]